jgi:YHS domain-containing protein
VLRVIVAFLLRVFAFLATLWFIKRLFRPGSRRNAQAPGPGAGPERAPQQKETVKDPVCGMYMDPRLAIRQEEGGESLFFCSEECRQKYLATRE